MTASASLMDAFSDDGLALPRDFEAGYGEGLRIGLSLGGGGLYFIAWQVAYLHELTRRGVELGGADRVVGTSAVRPDDRDALRKRRDPTPGSGVGSRKKRGGGVAEA